MGTARTAACDLSPGGHQPRALTQLPRLSLDKLRPTPECSQCQAQLWHRSTRSALVGLLWPQSCCGQPPVHPSSAANGMGCAGGAHPNSSRHQGHTPGHLCLLCSPQQPSTGCSVTLGAWDTLCFHFPLSWASWAPAADVHTSDAIPAFHNTDTESRRQPDIITLLPCLTPQGRTERLS